MNGPLKTRRERGLVSRLLFTFWPGGIGGSYFYSSYYLISVKHHEVKFSKDTDCASLRNVWWWSITWKKNDGNCIIARSAWCKVSVIFFSGDSSITKQTNKFIPCHLIMYIKTQIFCYKLSFISWSFLLYILWRLIISCRFSIYVTDRFFSGDTKSPQYFNQ